jgi:hypothetical protein
MEESTQLVGVIAPYLPMDRQGVDAQKLIYALVAAAVQWCGQHASGGTLGAAVDAAAAQAHLALRPDIPGLTPPILIVNMAPLPATDVPDAVTLAGVDVFRRTCLTFGNAAALRAWATGARLREIPPVFVLPFAAGEGARGFGVNTAQGGMALISLDSGTCQVVVRHGIAGRFEAALEHVSWGPDFSLRALKDVTDPVHGTRQRIYNAEAKGWGQEVSVTGKPYVPPQVGDPLIVLLSTPRRQAI